MLKNSLLFCLIFTFIFSINAQESELDSLLNLLSRHNTEDTLKVQLLNEIAEYYADDNVSKFKEFVSEAHNLSEKLNYKNGIAENIRLHGLYQENLNKNIDSAMIYYNKALDLFYETDDFEGIVKTLNDIAFNYFVQNDLVNSVLYFIRKYEKLEKTNLRTEKLNTLSKITTIYYNISEYDKSLKYNQIGIELSREYGDKDQEANFLNNSASAFKRKGELAKALEILNESLKVCIEAENKAITAYIYNNMANIYGDYGDNIKAVEYYLLTLKTCEELGNKSCLAVSYNNIAIVYYTQKDYAKTIEYLFKSLDVSYEIEDDENIANALNNIAELYLKQDSAKKSLEYYNKSYPIIKKLNNRYLMYYNYSGEAAVYDKMGEFDKSIEYHIKGLKTAMEIEARHEIALSYKGLSNHYYLMGKPVKATQYADSALTLGQEFGVTEIIKESAEILYKSYADLNQFKKAFRYHVLFTEMNDSISNDDNTKKVTQLEMQYKHEKDIKEREVEQAKKDLLKEKELHKQKNIRNIFIVAFVFVLIMVFLVLRSYRQKKKANELLAKQKSEIEDKNEELNQLNSEISRQKDQIEKSHKKITDSIKYAERIQSALLPTNENFKELLPNHFIFYKPRDIVSGDFYWIRKVDKYILVAVADCTGHGVPGAMMSMLGISFLNDISRRKDIDKPSKILSQLRKQVKKSLKQTGRRDEARDGMDMAFCEINTEINELQYSGANNPLYLFRNGELIEYKADKQPISIYLKEREFTDHTIQLEKGDTFYLFSDGFMDQISVNNKKYSSHGLKKTLKEIHTNSMESQKELLENLMNTWMGDSSNQVDDILIVGFRV